MFVPVPSEYLIQRFFVLPHTWASAPLAFASAVFNWSRFRVSWIAPCGWSVQPVARTSSGPRLLLGCGRRKGGVESGCLQLRNTFHPGSPPGVVFCYSGTASHLSQVAHEIKCREDSSADRSDTVFYTLKGNRRRQSTLAQRARQT